MKNIVENVKVYGLEESIRRAKFPMAVDTDSLNCELTKGIKALAQSNTGEGHDVFLGGIVVQFDLTCSVKMWTEFQRYHFAEFISSQSQMHRIARFNLDDQYDSHVDPRIIAIIKEKVEEYNQLLQNESSGASEKYLEILYSNPCGFKLTAGITTNYRQLKTMYKQRKNHRLPEWREFCKWIETLPMSELIIGENQ